MTTDKQPASKPPIDSGLTETTLHPLPQRRASAPNLLKRYKTRSMHGDVTTKAYRNVTSALLIRPPVTTRSRNNVQHKTRINPNV